MKDVTLDSKKKNQQIVEGIKLANISDLTLEATEHAIIVKKKKNDKVSIVVSGCAREESMLGNVLGENLADAIITVPNLNPYSIMRVAISVNYGKGILLICNTEEKENYMYASSFLEESGIESEVLFARDNVSPQGINDKNKRQASAGIFYCTKIAGAAAAQGLSLRDIYQISRKARRAINSVSIRVADSEQLSDNSMFDVEKNLKVNIGIAGDELEENVILGTPEEVANNLLFHLIYASGISKRDKVCTYLSGFGGISFHNLAILNVNIKNVLDEKGVEIYDMQINPISQTNSYIGATLSIMRMDEQLKEFYDMPCKSLYYSK